MEIVRVLFAITINWRWPVSQFDVKSAFLNIELKEEVFVDQAKGFTVARSEGIVYKFYKALYGLKQAPRFSVAR